MVMTVESKDEQVTISQALVATSPLSPSSACVRCSKRPQVNKHRVQISFVSRKCVDHTVQCIETQVRE